MKPTECDRLGHDVEHQTVRDDGHTVEIRVFWCARCGAALSEATHEAD